MVSRLRSRLSSFQDFMNGIGKDDEQHILRGAFFVSGLFKAFQLFRQRYLKEDLYQHLNSAYDQLDQHLDMLERGKVVFDEIPNPKALLFQLKERLLRRNQEASHPTSLAVVLSLANDYRRRQRVVLGS